jgi:general stress protein CsbA
MFSYFEKAFGDPLFLRVLMALWSVPMFFIVAVAAASWPSVAESFWLLVLTAVALLMGLVLVGSAFFSDDKSIRKISDDFPDGGQVILVVVLIVIAVPVYEIARLVRSELKDS